MTNSKTPLSIILLFAITLFTVSCDKGGPVFEKYLKLTNSAWDRFDIKQFEIPTDEDATNFEITVVVHCTEQFKPDNLPLYVILTSSTGEESVRDISVPVRENGKLITELKGTKPDSRLVLWRNITIPKGMTRITIENLIPKIQTGGIDEIGIVVTKSK